MFASVDDKSAIKEVISNSSGLGLTGTKIASPGKTLLALPLKRFTCSISPLALITYASFFNTIWFIASS